MRTEKIEFQGVIYTRYPESDRWPDRWYYRNGAGKNCKRLHRVVWESVHGPIPAGAHIHHKDGNPLNNDIDNLECLTSSEHAALHFEGCRPQKKWAVEHLERIRPLATHWHQSEEGREWHRQHGYETAAAAPLRKLVCEWCHREYESRVQHNRNRFCSNRCCAAERRASGVDDVERTCPGCGKVTTINRYAQSQYCSTWCGRRHRSKG